MPSLKEKHSAVSSPNSSTPVVMPAGQHTRRVHSIHPDPGDPSTSLGKKTARSLTTYPHPENVVRIQRLLDMYRFDIEMIEDKSAHADMNMLTAAALVCDLPRHQDRYEAGIRAFMNRRQYWIEQGTKVVVPALRERTEALQVMLFMVNRPQLFQEKMADYISRFVID
ncbi:hypothetical protein GJ744_004000 [Endocarpon pusillum]|uniref:Uncharacterized protein n=1 Tax=Endocarpon pusillum TaxID=364733 RepID=A0A8H7DXU5_9EURO|nr:hypothetical protein GJ744_004000 [Endocarpon pusillum]